MRSFFWDFLTLAGVGTTTIGVAFVHWPTAIIVAGLALMVTGILGAFAYADRRRIKSPDTEPPQG